MKGLLRLREVIKISDRLGEIRYNNQGTAMKIIKYTKSNDIDIEFLDDHHYIKKHVAYSNFIRGQIKNPYDKSLFGIGYIGDGNHIVRKGTKGKLVTAYETWTSMLERCYKNQELFPAYFGICTVCKEWHNYQTFADWYDENKYSVNERLHIDKDILYPNAKLYSPETCLLVPQRINMLFLNKPNKNGLPNGIRKTKSGKYTANYNGEKIDTYNTIEEAYEAYAKKKEYAIKKIADEYKEIIPLKVYNALIHYKVLITNDENYRLSK